MKIRLKNPDEQTIFIKKNVRNHSDHQFYPVLAKIRVHRGLLYNRDGFEKLDTTKLFNAVISSSKTEPKVPKQFKTILSNPI